MGSLMNNVTAERTPKSTLGVCVKSGNIEGFITCAHGNRKDDKITGVATDVFGKITKIQMGGKVDAAFVAKGTIGNIPLTNKILLNSNPIKTGTVSSAGGVIENAVLRYGTTSGYSIAVVESTSWEGSWNGSKDPNNSYTDMSDILPPPMLTHRGGGFSFDSTNVLSISELTPCVPRFL